MGNTSSEIKRVNKFLSKKVYENELKFKRSAAEIECITCAVKTLMEHITSLVVNEDPLCEISHQYLVGSMQKGPVPGNLMSLTFWLY